MKENIDLRKKGKRRCTLCKNIYDLNSKNFVLKKIRKEPESFQFVSRCRGCYNRKNAEYSRGKKFKNFRVRFVEINGNKCRQCQIVHADASFFDVDHIKPTKGRFAGKRKRWTNKISPSEKDNLQVLCPNCHRLKTIEDRKNR